MSLLGKINIDFMAKRKVAMILSVIMVTVSIAAVVVKGLNLGLDFTGGTIVVVKFDSPAEIPKIRSTLQESGYPNVIVKNFGSSKDIEITIPPHKADGVEGGIIDEAEISDNIIKILRGVDSSVELNKVDYIGGQVGDELIEQGSLALLYAIIGILIYVTFRFEWRFSLGAVIALVHDVIITTGVFAITQVQFDLTVLAALLAVIGYSLNDTIVVFDRVRENFRKVRKKSTEEIFNISINQTLSR
ncbi:MAG: protein translocase subunit SecF, partial [Proteobacteria bacterium]|nr:protein translocase subunit SecF [Pseudomonadota bacterium]